MINRLRGRNSTNCFLLTDLTYDAFRQATLQQGHCVRTGGTWVPNFAKGHDPPTPYSYDRLPHIISEADECVIVYS